MDLDEGILAAMRILFTAENWNGSEFAQQAEVRRVSKSGKVSEE